jgi:hypothetical protein
MRNHLAVRIDDGRVGHALRVDRRLEDRAQPPIVANREVGISGGRDDGAGTLVDGTGQQLPPRLTLFEPNARLLGQGMDAQRRDHCADERSDAENLLRTDREAHGELYLH